MSPHPFPSLHPHPPRRRRLADLLPWLLGAWLASAPGAAAGQGFDVACPTPEEDEVTRLVNLERGERGLAPVVVDVRLTASALRHSEDMLDGCFLSHTGSDGSSHGDRIEDAGYPLAWAGEVAAVGQRSASEVVQDWMGSPGHYGILMHPGARHIGVAYGAAEVYCTLQGHGFAARDFWTANLASSAGPAESPLDHCSEDGTGSAVPACSNGHDDDGDGRTDYGADLGCSAPDDPSEAHDCADGLDNDADGLIDHPADPECLTEDQWSEVDPACGLGFEVVPFLLPLMAQRRRLRQTSV